MISEKTSYRKIATEAYINYNIAMVERESGFEKREKVSPYKEFQPGDRLDFTLKSINSNNTLVEEEKSVVIDEVRSGGFFGKVLIPKDEPFVIKTSLPDPFLHYWRSVNWDYSDLPARLDETWAQLEHLATKIIHDVLPVLSNGKFYSPDSLGYTRLSTGFAQVIEKIDDGRPDKLEPADESPAFKTAQKELLELGIKLGLEQIAQVHPDNPFGMANVWLNPKTETFVWLDTNPAIPHRKVVKPFFRYKFHKELREEFGKEVTFNEIHTDRLFRVLYDNRNLFPENDFTRIIENVKLYKKLYDSKPDIPKDPKIAERAWAQFEKDLLTENGFYKLLTDSEFRIRIAKNIARYLKDPQYRKKIYEDTILSGVKEARENRVITEEEFKSSEKVLEEENSKHSRKATVFPSLFAWYILSGQFINIFEGGFYANAAFFADDKLAATFMGFLIGRGVPLILNPSSTLLLGIFTKTDLREAAKISAIPWAGPLIAIPAQIRKDVGGSDLLWHYLIRDIAAKFSKLDPAGGYGSEREAKIYRGGKKTIKNLSKQAQNLRNFYTSEDSSKDIFT